MRASLLYNPFDIVERLAVASRRRRRLGRLRGTPAAKLSLGHLDSLELLESLASAPPCVIHDIGANVGTWTCLAKSLYPKAFVEAFEPLEMHHAGFRQWTSPWPDVKLHPVALGASDGTASIEVTGFSDASSILSLTEEGRRIIGTVPTGRKEVPLLTLDGLVRSGVARPPDLIKLDVQGYELEVLRGAEHCLRNARSVLTEVSFRPFYRDQALFGDILSFLESHGFRLHAFGPNLGPGEPLEQTDALFLKS